MKCPNCETTLEFSYTCLDCGLSLGKTDWLQSIETDHSHHVSTFQKFNSGIELGLKTSAWLYPLIQKFMRIRDMVFRCSSLPWNRVSLIEMLLLSSGFITLFYLLKTKSMLGDDSVFLDLIHNVNLVFHEAGHWIFALSGNVLFAIFGGSLNQILIPLIVTVAFWLNRDTLGFTFGLFWCFENFLDVAFYIADAQALVLPLLGDLGKEGHDWHILLRYFDLLDQAPIIAENVRLIGWFGMFAAWAWFLERWWLNQGSSKQITLNRQQDN